jgi:putative ABC transport system permease protein
MSLNIRPLLSALRRSPTGAVLVTLQVAITLAVLANAAFLVRQHIAEIEQPVGLDTRDTFGMIVGPVSDRFNVARAETEDLAYLRSLPGVTAAAATVGIPLTGMGAWSRSFWRQPGQRGAAVWSYLMDGSSRDLLRTLDVPLLAGRNFTPSEILPLAPGHNQPAEVILTRALAHALFPRGDALGRAIYDSDSDPLTVIGITANFMGAVGSGADIARDHVALIPTTPGQGGFYALVVRTRPGRRDGILRAARRHIGAAHEYGVIAHPMTLAAARDAFETNDRNVAIFLTAVTALMLLVCCLGIFGLATFNVGSRTRQIGTRRAVGARKRDIVIHFLLENALVLTAGALLGSVLALAIGDWLTAHYGLPRLDPAYLAAGILVLWVVGQLAAWQPARKAAAVPPSVATRTV